MSYQGSDVKNKADPTYMMLTFCRHEPLHFKKSTFISISIQFFISPKQKYYANNDTKINYLKMSF